jgi:transglutaminase-like putative cysteine protease
MKKLPHLAILILCTVLNALQASASSSVSYAVSEIPAPLLKNAKAVIRKESVVTEVQSGNKLIQKVCFAITVLNQNGKSLGVFQEISNDDIRVSGIKARVYNAAGIDISKRDELVVKDYALIPDFSIYSDDRVMVIVPQQPVYPYTVEYQYEVTYSGVLQYPDWEPVRGFNVSVQQSEFNLILPKDSDCRFLEKNLDANTRLRQENPDKISYTWRLNNLTALTEENFGPDLEDITPGVMLAPTKILVEGYPGQIDTWNGFGQWINQLNQGRNNLTPEAVDRVKSLISGITDTRSQVKKLYEYMQSRTRYVSVSVGIGGFQPFEAAMVDRLGYGDCKALTNYMKSLLEAAGIPSFYTLVYAGAEKPAVRNEFPTNQFNHVILCVPMGNDTVWLENTSQTNPFNYLGTFTADRQVLIVNTNGATMSRTPALDCPDNLETRTVFVNLDAQGGGTAEARNKYYGATYDHYAGILSSDQTDRKRLVTRRIHLPNFELDQFSINENRSEHPFVTENLSLSLTSYGTPVGEKIMLCLNLMNRLPESPLQEAARKNPVIINWPVCETDTIVYKLPQGYTLEKTPAEVRINTSFGTYTTQVSRDGNQLTYIRSFNVFKGSYPVDQYSSMVEFFDRVVTADENKVMLTRTL